MTESIRYYPLISTFVINKIKIAKDILNKKAHTADTHATALPLQY